MFELVSKIERDVKPLKLKTSDWKFNDLEEAHFAERRTIPTWKVANVSRRLLAAATSELGTSGEELSGTAVTEVSALAAQQVATIQLAAMTVRSTGAVMMLIAAGYERESFMPMRVLFELGLRASQVFDDGSGEAARNILLGQPRGSVKSLAHRYGNKQTIEFLDRFAHADASTMMALSLPAQRVQDADEGVITVNLAPNRSTAKPASQLFAAALICGQLTAHLANLFDVEILMSPWLQSELLHWAERGFDDEP